MLGKPMINLASRIRKKCQERGDFFLELFWELK